MLAGRQEGDGMDWRCIRAGLMLSALVLAAACARELHPPPPAHTPLPVAPRPAVTTPAAADYVAASGSIDLFVIRSSELALERSSSRRVRDFAAAMIEAHKGTSAQLSLAGRRLNLLPAAALRPSEQQRLDALGQAADFDATYVRQQRLIHQQALALHQDYAARGQSATLRAVALATAPIMRRHLAMLAVL
jgi:putative membrane protein